MKHLLLDRLASRAKYLLYSVLVSVLLGTVLFAVLPQGIAQRLSLSTSAHAASSNPIVLENQQAGSTGWQFDNYNKASNHEIEGYASLTSVNQGGQISFMVSLNSTAQYTMDIYRMGYYPHGTNPDGSACVGPCGGRLMQHIGPLSGSKQAACPTTTSGNDFGLIECHWTTAYTLTVPTTWTTGNYIVKLTRNDNALENYMTFVVRSDGTPADIVYSMDVSTWQAYNYWGGAGNGDIGYNLYGKFNDVNQNVLSNTRAYTVSFDRPYIDQGAQDGAGNYMVWDYPMTRWMEAQGYNVTYVTSVDLENTPNLFSGRKVFTNTGHDEYYSDNMRSNLQHAISNGVNMAFFSANDIGYRVLWQNSSSSQTYRQIHCDKGAIAGSNTTWWRDLSPAQPENMLTGVLQNGVANSRPFLVYDPTSWIYTGTGLTKYNGTVVTSGSGQNAIVGLIGYEFDERAANDPSLSTYVSYEPAGLKQLGHSAVPASDNGKAAYSDAVLYTASSGATVFSAGTIQWSWGLDNAFNDGFCDCNTGYANTASQQITSNILNRFISVSLTIPAVSLSQTTANFNNQNLSTSSSAQTVTLTNSGSGALTINSIALAGTNASDFAQTNNCPTGSATLAAGASCTISITFTPTTAGAHSATITLTDNAGDSPQSIALSGTGVSQTPAATLSASSVNFKNQNLNTTSTATTVTLTNNGQATLTIGSITLAGTNASDFAQTNNCPGSLASSAACTLSITFTPTANGSRSAAITLTDNAADSPQSISLSGTGVTPAAAVTLSASSVNFGTQKVGATGVPRTVTLTNSGTSPLTITSMAMSGTNAGDFAQTNNCPTGSATLAINASCTISITLNPSASGARSATLTITDNAPNSPQTIALSGNGVVLTTYFSDGFESGDFSKWTLPHGDSSGQLSVESTLFNRGTHAASFVNTAGQYAYLNTALPSGAQAQTSTRFYFRFSNLTSGTQIAIARNGNGSNAWEADYDNNNHSLNVYFWNASNAVYTVSSAKNVLSPDTWYCIEVADNQATTGHGEVWIDDTSIGSVDANLQVSSPFTNFMLYSSAPGTIYFDDVQVSNNYNGPLAPVPSVNLNPTSLNFGNQTPATTSAARTITLTNNGSAPLTINSIGLAGTNASDFARSTTCPLSPSTLAINASCTLSVTFTPGSNVARSGNITIVDNAPDSPQIVALNGTGAPPAPVVSLNSSSLSFGNQKVGVASSAQVLTLTNSGSAPLTISSIGLAGTNASDFAQSTTCPNTLAINTSCTINVTFTPAANGSRSANVTLTDNAADSPQSLPLSGTGITSMTYFSDSFESGNFGQWTLPSSDSNGSRTVQTKVVHSGTNAAAFTNAANQYSYIYTTLPAGAQALTYTRFYFQLASQTTSTQIAIARNANGNNIWEIDYDANHGAVDVFFWNATHNVLSVFSSNQAITPGTWYSIEVMVNESTTGQGEAWLNGTSLGSVAGDLSLAPALDRLMLYSSVAGTIYFDDVAVANTYNGPVSIAAVQPASTQYALTDFTLPEHRYQLTTL